MTLYHTILLSLITLAPLSAQTPTPTPAVPSYPVTLQWDDNSSDETSFVIQRSHYGTSYTDVGTVAANVTTFTDSVPLGSYYWRVRAVNSVNKTQSSYSNIVTYTAVKPTPTPTPLPTPTPVPVPPNAPANLRASQ